MAKTDNLIDFLTSLANKIREHTGDTGTINPQDFENKIDSIASSSGGGGDDFMLPECKITLDSNIERVMYWKYSSTNKQEHGYGILKNSSPREENPISVPWGSLIFLNPNNQYITTRENGSGGFYNVASDAMGLASTFTAYRIDGNGSIRIRR